MIIRKVRLQNIRGFDDITLDLTAEDGRPRLWTTIIGMNGTGKTSLLRAVVLGMSAETDASAMLAAPVGTFVTRGKKYGTIDLTVRTSRRGRKDIALRTRIEVGKEHETIRRTTVNETRHWPRAFVVGYGTGDQVPPEIRNAIMIMAADMDINRASPSAIPGVIVEEIPKVAERLLWPHRILLV